MVKLKVTARVIPEDIYIRNADSSPTSNTPIRGERRLFVIIRDPEKWYIGTLALEIKRRYESLYKHDLGQIKYLKDNQDDCDLDPELYVNDVLVDEGKAQIDPSDQHVTVKVIQEQGRNLRHGSVIPDLSQVHYQLPERLSRPPIPTFNDLNSQLGKRKAQNDLARTSTERKRTRLDEIEEEEDDVVASIERAQPLQSDVIVENTQFTTTSPMASKRPHKRNKSSTGEAWSFNNIGPPVAVGKSPHQERTESYNSREELSSEQQIQSTEPVKAQPLTGTPSVHSPKTNGMQTISPLAAVSSASKKFLNSRMNLYAGPESDIDDSQMSPGSKDTTRITPRLVPSGKAVGPSSNGLANHRSSSRELSAVSEKSVSISRRPDAAHKSTLSTQGNSVSVIDESKGQSSDEDGSESSTSEQEQVDIAKVVVEAARAPSQSHHSSSESDVSNEESVASDDSPDSLNGGSDKSDEELSKVKPKLDKMDSNFSAPQTNGNVVGLLGQHVVVHSPRSTKDETIPKIQQNGQAEEVEDGSSDITSEHPSKEGAGPKKRRRRSKKTFSNIDDVGQDLTRNMNTDQTEVAKRVTPLSRAVASEVSTPAPDSPSEQLSQALQESTRKTTRTKALRVEPAIPIVMEATRKNQVSPLSKNEVTESNINGADSSSFDKSAEETLRAKSLSTTQDKAPSVRFDEDMDLDQSVEKTLAVPAMLSNGVSIANSANVDAVSVVATDRAAREASTDSRMTSSSKAVVLPLGMTQEEYDRILKQHAHLNSGGPKAVQQKKKATPSLRQTPSVELPGGRIGTALSRETPKQTTAKGSKVVTSVSSAAKADSAKKSVGAINSTGNSAAEPNVLTAKTTLSRAASSKGDDVGSSSLARSKTSTSTSTSDKPQTTIAKSPSTAASIRSASTKSAPRSSPKLPASAGQRGPSPSLSSSSKITSSTAKPTQKKPASTALNSMPPPFSSSVTKASIATPATPTPKPRTKAAAAKASKPAPVPTVIASQPKPSAPKRPAPPPAFSSARTLQELRTMVNSVPNSTASNSPAPSTSRFVTAKKSILNDDSDSSSDSSSEDDDDTSTDKDTKSIAKPTPANTRVSKPATATKRPAIKNRPDPTIRDASVDSSEAESDD